MSDALVIGTLLSLDREDQHPSHWYLALAFGLMNLSRWAFTVARLTDHSGAHHLLSALAIVGALWSLERARIGGRLPGRRWWAAVLAASLATVALQASLASDALSGVPVAVLLGLAMGRSSGPLQQLWGAAARPAVAALWLRGLLSMVVILYLAAPSQTVIAYLLIATAQVALGLSLLWGYTQVRRTTLALRPESPPRTAPIPVGVVRVQLPHGALVDANQTFLDMLGWTHVQDGMARGALHGVAIGHLLDTLSDCRDLRGQLLQLRRENGTVCSARVADVVLTADKGETVMALALHDWSDAIEARALEERRLRMAALGRLADTVVHDVNNVLGVVVASADLLEAEHGPSEMVDTLRDATSTAKRLMDRLGTVDGRTPKRTAEVDLQAMGQRLSRMLITELPETVRLETELGPATVPGDPSALESVIFNLLVNARDAVTAKGGGQILLTIDRAGDGVHIDVEDDGPGIDPAVLPHIFEPFYTTKDAGTGLGLATVYGHVRGHGGHIDVESSVGGTAFRVRLP